MAKWFGRQYIDVEGRGFDFRAGTIPDFFFLIFFFIYLFFFICRAGVDLCCLNLIILWVGWMFLFFIIDFQIGLYSTDTTHTHHLSTVGVFSQFCDILARNYAPLIRSWSINDLEYYFKLNMLQEHYLNAHCSKSSLLYYAPGTLYIQICSWVYLT